MEDSQDSNFIARLVLLVHDKVGTFDKLACASTPTGSPSVGKAGGEEKIELAANAPEDSGGGPRAVLCDPRVDALQVFDGLQGVALGCLRGMADTRVPMVIHLVGFWGVAIPASLYLAHARGLGAHGLWWGLALGLFAVALVQVWRVRARLRRPTLARNDVIERGALRVDLARHQVFVDGREVRLTPAEHSILVALAKRPDAAVTRESLAEVALDEETEDVRGTLDAHVSRLRKKLGAECVQTVWGVGYRLGTTAGAP